MQENPVDRWQVVLAACILTGIGTLMFVVLPVFLAAAAKKFDLNEAEVDYLPAGFYTGFTLLSSSTVFWVRTWRRALYWHGWGWQPPP